MKRQIREKRGTHPWLVCVHDDTVVGYSYASPLPKRGAYQWSVESSVYVDPGYHRCGVGRGLYEALLATLELQGYQNVYAAIALPNRASTAFHESVGFEPIGVFERVGYKNRQWHDVKWWHRSLGEHPGNPDEPRTVQEVCSQRQWDEALEAGESRVGL